MTRVRHPDPVEVSRYARANRLSTFCLRDRDDGLASVADPPRGRSAANSTLRFRNVWWLNSDQRRSEIRCDGPFLSVALAAGSGHLPRGGRDRLATGADSESAHLRR